VYNEYVLKREAQELRKVAPNEQKNFLKSFQKTLDKLLKV
jgi:hypothetical protein